MGLLQYSLVRNIYFSPVFILSWLYGIFLLLMTLVFQGPRWMFKKTERKVRPDCMNDPQLGTHKFIKLKELSLHAVESGDPSKPLMLFLHGFPECWFSWRHQIKAFNKDYHCVAVDMRGTGESDAPPAVKNYVIDKLVGDVRDLIQALGHSSCVLVSHDWGGIVGWTFAAHYPEMVDKFIALNISHPDRMAELVSSFLPQTRMSWYIFFFQLPRLPEMLMTMGDYAPIGMGLPKGKATEEEREAFKFAFSQPGKARYHFLNYYRNILSTLFTETGKVNVPSLLIWGTADQALHTKLSYDMEKFCPDLRVERIEGGQHFIQQDHPEKVTDFIKDFLTK
ncbi:epoxide hydrolase 1-like [Diadema setosum]|uniref:epoxide hydrolase 1-like n=1 Tax=Diadema setosum TaxID=31175 RepID=UPI003B3A86B7